MQIQVRELPGRLAAWRRLHRRLAREYRGAHGRRLRLFRPRTYTEKMQWRKVFDHDPRYPRILDKVAVRRWIGRRIGDDLLVPVQWVGRLPRAIPFEDLVTPYVLKSTHASGQVVIVGPGEEPDVAGLRRRARGWLGVDHAQKGAEWGYSAIRPRLVVESRIGGDEPPLERRVFVFGGRACVVNTVVVEDDRIRNAAFHDLAWQRLPWWFTREPLPGEWPRPERLDDMVAAAEAVAADLDHARVDFYDGGAEIWIGEITLYSWSGMSRFNPPGADHELGAAWHLRRPLRRAVRTILTTDPVGAPAARGAGR
ncbi:MAG: ATP-grasp fold amidoligase family protein [Marmoricola sp.]